MKRIFCLLFIFSLLILVSCKVSYSFKGTTIDYSKTQRMYIKDFQNQALYIYPPLAQRFNEHLKDIFSRNTKLTFTSNDPQRELEGEITRYDVTPLAAKSDGYASIARLTMEVKIRYRDNQNPDNDREETFSAYQEFPSDKMLTDVQDNLIQVMTDEIVDQIFNTTQSNW